MYVKLYINLLVRRYFLEYPYPWHSCAEGCIEVDNNREAPVLEGLAFSEGD